METTGVGESAAIGAYEVAKVIQAGMLELGYTRNHPQFVRDDLRRNGVVSLKSVPGGEIGYYLRPSGGDYTIKGWTSIEEATEEYRPNDYGFILIVRDDGYVAYWAKLLRRTKNFSENFLLWAQKCAEMVRSRPICPDDMCRCYMHIVPGRKGKGLMWACLNDKLHGRAKGPVVSIDHGLSARMLAFSKRQRALRAYDRKDPRRKSPRTEWGFGNRSPAWKRTFSPADKNFSIHE